MELETALAFAADRHKGVLLTLRGNGRPQASNIMYAVLDGAVQISVTADRAKVRNVERDPRASLHVTTDDFWQYVVIEAEASLTPVTVQPGDDTALALRAVYEAVRGGPHPDWDDFDRAMVDEGRRVLRLAPERAYGLLRDA